MSFDGSGFRKRSSSGIWQSVADAAGTIEAAGEDPSFYAPSDEHRCISSAAALILYSMLAEELRDEASMARLSQVGECFTAEFFDAQTCRFRRSNAPSEAEYWRAADQAMGCLACLRLAKLGLQTAQSRAMATCAADSLLLDFGYSLYAREGQPPGTYLGRVAPRNSWHDCLAAFALLSSGVLGVGGESPAGLVRALVESYSMRAADGAMAVMHRPRERRGDGEGGDEVAFTSTQALWSAVLRAADLTSDKAEALGGVDVPALRAFYEAHRDDESGLLCVANVYPDARLWANTEWATWLLLSREDFTSAR